MNTVRDGQLVVNLDFGIEIRSITVPKEITDGSIHKIQIKIQPLPASGASVNQSQPTEWKYEVKVDEKVVTTRYNTSNVILLNVLILTWTCFFSLPPFFSNVVFGML